MSDVVRTASGYGALAASRTQVVGIDKDTSGKVVGARLADLESGQELTVKAKHIINATGVWTEESESLANPDAGLEVLASKGIHIVVPRDRIQATSGISRRPKNQCFSLSRGSATGLLVRPIPRIPRIASACGNASGY